MTNNSPIAAPYLRFWRSKTAICLMLAVVTVAVYLPVLQCQFVNYDDNVFVTENPHIRNGLAREAMDWSFAAGLIYSSPNVDYWRPLSYLSHALDIQLFGLHPAGHHLMNLAIHVATTLALFLVLNSMTGALWRSAFVAALFALHPLHVESVAWIAERKDVLSGLFFILTLGAYAGYSRNPSASRYLLALGLFGLALMSKPIVVTLPFVLLLLDYWPLGRLSRLHSVPARQAGVKCQVSGPDSHVTPHASRFTPQISRLLLEKLPFFLLAMGLSMVTFRSQKTLGTMAVLSHVTLPARMENALVSYAAYLLNLFWPVNLAVFYPYNTTLPMWQVAGAFILLAAITLLVLAAARRCPWLPVGWFWYLGMLLPVIGILQVGAQARADRYTYLSTIGLLLMVTWAVGDLCPPWPRRKLVLGALMTAVLAILTVCTSSQISYWRNSETLWTHALACTSNNMLAHNNLSNELLLKGSVDDAVIHGQKALQIKPDYAEAHASLGNALLQQGSVDEAIVQYQKALEIKPDLAEAHNNLGNALLQKGSVDEAITHFEKTAELKPGNAEAQYNLGNAFAQKGSVDEAISHYQKALEIKPDYAEAHNNLGLAFFQKGQMAQVITHYQKALEINPNNAAAQNNLAWMLAICPQASLRNGNQAVELAQRADQLYGGNNPLVLRTLAAAYAEAGRFPEAMETAQRALQLAEAQSNPALANDLRSLVKLFQAGVPYHLPEPTPQK